MMNALHNSLTIAFLAVSIIISGLSADLASAQSSGTEPIIRVIAEADTAAGIEERVLRVRGLMQAGC